MPSGPHHFRSLGPILHIYKISLILPDLMSISRGVWEVIGLRKVHICSKCDKELDQ